MPDSTHLHVDPHYPILTHWQYQCPPGSQCPAYSRAPTQCTILPCLAAEGRGQLWLYAGIATFLGVPFNLLMMSPPTPFLQPPQPPMAARLQPYAQHKQELAAAEGGHGYETIPEEASTGSGGGTPFAEGVAGYGEEGRAGGGYLPMGRPASPDAPRRRLMYAKSGGWPCYAS